MTRFSAAQRRRQHSDFPGSQLPPTSAGQVPEVKIPDRHADQPQRGMPNRRCHAPHLPVSPLANPQFDPAILNIFPKANGRIARWKFGLRVQKPCACWQRGFAVEKDTIAELPQSRFTGKPLHKHMVGFFDMVGGREQTRIPTRFIGEQQQSLRVRIQAPDGIHTLGKSKLRQRTVRAAIRRELREHAIGFVKSEDQRILRRVRSCESTTPIGRRLSSSTTRSSMRWRSKI